MRVRRYVGRGSLACPAIRPHFFGACPKKRCRAAKEKRFEATTSPWWAHPPLPFGRKPQRDKLMRQVGLYTVGKLARQSQLDAVGCDVGASSPWERWAGPNTSRGGIQKRVSLGLHPVSLRKSKEMGWNGQQGGGASAQENGAHVKGANKVPPFLWLCTCAPIRWEVVVSLSCLSTPFLWCLPKETVSSRQRKALFYLGGSTIRVSAASR